VSTNPIRGIHTYLTEQDVATRPARAQRLAEVMLLGEPEDGRIFHGVDPASALIEAQWSYINGFFLCTILASQTCLEKLLSGVIEDIGIDLHRASYAQLLATARDQSVLTQPEYSLFDRLRRARNPYVHHRKIDHRENIFRRAMDSGNDPDSLLQKDAKHALMALIGLVNRPPFGLGPVSASITEQDVAREVHPGQLSLLGSPE
jgi:hypothetical protein